MGEPPPAAKSFLLGRAKMLVQCTSAGQFSGQKTIGELLLLLKKGNRQNNLAGQPLTPPKI